MAQPKRKSPERRPSRKKQPSRAAALLYASGAVFARYPRLWAGLASFGVVFSFVAANALWYQPKHHPAPLLATRAFGDDAGKARKIARQDAGAFDSEPGVTTFRIERQSEMQANVPTEVATAPSDLVMEVQKGLAARGLYDGPADGLIGPKTTSAILFFQETEGLDMTGEPSGELVKRLRNVRKDVAVIPDDRPSMDQTASTQVSSQKVSSEAIDDIAALIKADDVPVPVVPAKTTPAVPVEMVMKIQKALAGMAYADVKVDGIAGEATRAAIRNFEKSYRLPVTGEPSERVLKKLKSIGAI